MFRESGWECIGQGPGEEPGKRRMGDAEGVSTEDHAVMNLNVF